MVCHGLLSVKAVTSKDSTDATTLVLNVGLMQADSIVLVAKME